ncbi:pyridoxamine 5'-phosphate oxidase family protein [Streptomyces sp. NPDC057238]|uniref:pyridoxamine 5'-phosphate oxidase family protein n=1 Tax=Streptomyces sp. NPDC057238 TaxID=3346060 RepID=UPI00363C3D89
MADFMEQVKKRLISEPVIWLATVDHNLAPQPNPVWFLWEQDGTDLGSVLTCTRAGARRIAHLQRNPRGTLNFNTDESGGSIVVLSGEAQVLTEHPAALDVPPYLDKYRSGIDWISGSPQQFSIEYPTAVRIRLTRVRGF